MKTTPKKPKITTTQPFNKPNYDRILECITERMNALRQEDQVLNHSYDKMKSQIQYARPCDIKISAGDGRREDDGDLHEVLKKIVKAAISEQPNSQASIRQQQVFQYQNQQTQSQISQKMQQIQNLQHDLKATQSKQQHTIRQLQHAQQSLKQILKSKGSLQQAQKYQKLKKSKINEIRSVRQLIKTLKEQKIRKIKEVIAGLEMLLQYRSKRKGQIEGKWAFGQGGFDGEKDLGILSGFVKNMEYLRMQKQKMGLMESNGGYNTVVFDNVSQNYGQAVSRETSAKKRLSSSYISGISTPKSSIGNNTMPMMPQTQKKYVQRKNNNQLQTKKLGNLRNSVLHTPKQSLPQILSQYQHIISQLQHLSQCQQSYFTDKKQRLQQQYKIKAIEKAYLIGILGYDAQAETSVEKYQSIVKFAMKKCVDFGEILENKAKERNMLVASMKSVEQSIAALMSQIQLIISQSQRKKSALTHLQSLLTSTYTSTKRPQIAHIQSQLTKNRTTHSLLQKQQQQYAEDGDLQNFKRISSSIEQLNMKYKELGISLQKEEQLEIENRKSLYACQNGEFWGRVEEVVGKFGVSIEGVKKGEGKEGDILAKLQKRLGNI